MEQTSPFLDEMIEVSLQRIEEAVRRVKEDRRQVAERRTVARSSERRQERIDRRWPAALRQIEDAHNHLLTILRQHGRVSQGTGGTC